MTKPSYVDLEVFSIERHLSILGEPVIKILLDEIKLTLNRGERVELRGFGIFSTKVRKS